MMMQICHRVCIVIFLPTILIIQITIIAARVVKAEDDHHYCSDSYDVAQEVYATEESWTGTTRRSTRRWCHHHPQHHDNNDNPNNNIINNNINNNNNNATFSSPLLLYFPFEDTYGNVRRPTTRTTTGPTTTTTRIGLPADLFPHHTTTITAGQKQRQQPLLFIQKDDNDAGAKLEKALFCNITPTYTTLTTATITTTTTTSKYTYKKKKNNTSSSSSSPTTSIKNHPPSNNHSGHASRNPLSPVRQWQEDNTTTMSMMRMGKSTAVNSHNASRMRIRVSSRNWTNVIHATATTTTITTTTNSTTQTTSQPTVEATVGMTTATTTATTTLPNKTTIQMNPQHNLEEPSIQQQQQHVKTPHTSSSTADNDNNNTHAKEETEEEEVPTNNNNNKKVDYSSKSVGAILLDSHPKFSGVGHLLQNDKDLYAIVPCAEVPVDVTIGLSEDILVKQVSISNYERYSGSMRTIHIFASTTIVPSSTSTPWKDLGTYQLSKESNGQQPHQQQQQPPKTTVLDLRTPVWARYLKIVFLDYYGTEYYCTVSQISVYGSTLLQGFHEQEIAAAAAAAVTDDDDEEAAEEEEEHQNNDEIQNSNNGDTVEEPSRDTTTTTTRMVKQPKDVDATVVVVTTLDSKDDTFQKTHTGNGVPSTANIAFVLEDSRWKDLNDPDKGINSLHCFEELILNALQWENRSMSDEHACLSSSSSLAMFRAPPVFSKDLPIKAGTTKSHVPLTNHHLVAEEESEHSKPLDRVDTTTTTITSKTTSSTPPMDDAKLQLLLDLLQRFPNAKCLEDLKNFPKLKSKASTGHAPNHDGGLEPIFTKFSSEIKALQADVSSLTKYTKLSNDCYQTLLLQVVLDQQKTQRDHAERLENLENSWIIHYSWYTNVKSFVTTNARDLVHGGKRLSTVLGLTSPAWKDSTFCGVIGLLLLVIFVYLGGSRYQGRITIRRQCVRAVPDVLSLNQSSAPPITDQEKQSKSLATSFESDEPSTVVSLDETTSPNHHPKQKKRRKHRFSLIRRDATSTNSV